MPCYDALFGTGKFGFSSWGTLCEAEDIVKSSVLSISETVDVALSSDDTYEATSTITD